MNHDHETISYARQCLTQLSKCRDLDGLSTATLRTLCEFTTHFLALTNHLLEGDPLPLGEIDKCAELMNQTMRPYVRLKNTISTELFELGTLFAKTIDPEFRLTEKEKQFASATPIKAFNPIPKSIQDPIRPQLESEDDRYERWSAARERAAAYSFRSSPSDRFNDLRHLCERYGGTLQQRGRRDLLDAIHPQQCDALTSHEIAELATECKFACMNGIY